MSVDVLWVNDEQTILTLVYSGQWTWGELHAAIAQRNTYLASVPHPVAVLSNLTEAHIKVPPNALSNVKNLTNRNPDNIELHVLVGMKPAHEALWHIIEKLFLPFWKSKNFFVARSVEEALAKIAQFQQAHSR